jgi:hypothetical protein
MWNPKLKAKSYAFKKRFLKKKGLGKASTTFSCCAYKGWAVQQIIAPYASRPTFIIIIIIIII